MKEDFKVGDYVKQVRGHLMGVIIESTPHTFTVQYDTHCSGSGGPIEVIYSNISKDYFDLINGSNPVSHPKHYNEGKIEVIEFIEDKKLNFHKGNAVKYIARAGIKSKDKEIEDLEKAIWYLKREIECLKADKDGREAIKPNDMKG